MWQFPPLHCQPMATLLGIIQRGDVQQMGRISKLLSPSKNDKSLRQQICLAPEI